MQVPAAAPPLERAMVQAIAWRVPLAASKFDQTPHVLFPGLARCTPAGMTCCARYGGQGLA